MTGEAELIAVGSKEWSDGALLGRFRTSFGSTDIELVGGRFRRRASGGFGWEGGVNPIGYWGEMALFERKERSAKAIAVDECILLVLDEAKIQKLLSKGVAIRLLFNLAKMLSRRLRETNTLLARAKKH